MTPLTRTYLAFSMVSGPLWRWSMWRRLRRGKETADRLPEKFGRAAPARPDGDVLWFHALSVGESLALLPLIERALHDMPKAHVLLTTSTATSIDALEKARLPERAIHCLLPIDTYQAVARFLRHWRPDVAVFAELDLWPRLLIETFRREIPMVLVNARMTEKTFLSRQRVAGIMADMLDLFDRMLVQDAETFERFKAFGADPAKIAVVGPLKSAARPLPADDAVLGDLRAQIRDRPVWLAAATYQSEHDEVLQAAKKVLEAEGDALLIIAPRHVRDGEALEQMAREAGLAAARRTKGQPITPETQVYIADTIGEMGLWYRLAPISFIGHSLDVAGDGLDGKNPFEAAALQSAILHGPDVEHFADSYAALAKAGGARVVHDADGLAEAVLALQQDELRAAFTAGADQVIKAQRSILENSWDLIRRQMPR